MDKKRETMKYKLENLAGKHQLLSEKDKYCLSGELKYVKGNILKLFSKSNIALFKVFEMQLLEEIEVTFEADSDQIE